MQENNLWPSGEMNERMTLQSVRIVFGECGVLGINNRYCFVSNFLFLFLITEVAKAKGWLLTGHLICIYIFPSAWQCTLGLLGTEVTMAWKKDREVE